MTNLFIIGTIDRLEEKKAVIKTEDGQQIIWPIEKMPNGIGEGEVVRLTILDDKGKTSEQENIAKALLNEILKADKNA